jgi:glutaminyl-peptide cyclotransferase
VRYLAAVALVVAVGCGDSGLNYTVVREIPHDTDAYTQGLLLHDGSLYESTGLLGRSELRRLDPQTGAVLASISLPADRFGEGLALLGDRLYQLTWKSKVGYVYDLSTLALLDSFAYDTEGWGLTTDGTSLIMGDGSSTLRVLDLETFEVTRQIVVRDGNSPLGALNELEYARGHLFANVYQSDWIVRIDPESGAVLEWIDLAGILPQKKRTPVTDVLNGIAYVESTGHLLVTGKRWPTMFELQLDWAPGEAAPAVNP